MITFKYTDAIQYLKTLKDALPELTLSDCLSKAAKSHVSDIGPKGILSHTGSDKSSYKERIERHCQWGGSIFEAIDYGLKESARETVISWLVDDGALKRKHRLNMLSLENKMIGVAKGPHKVSKECVVAVYAAQVVT